jgi:hypothetical protein
MNREIHRAVSTVLGEGTNKNKGAEPLFVVWRNLVKINCAAADY